MTDMISCAKKGASPSEGSSRSSTLGPIISAIAKDSMRCSPPLRVPAFWADLVCQYREEAINPLQALLANLCGPLHPPTQKKVVNDAQLAEGELLRRQEDYSLRDLSMAGHGRHVFLLIHSPDRQLA